MNATTRQITFAIARQAALGLPARSLVSLSVERIEPEAFLARLHDEAGRTIFDPFTGTFQLAAGGATVAEAIDALERRCAEFI